MKSKEQRKCIACNKIQSKYELIRIVKNKQGEISIDLENKKEGRGAYICNCEECLNKMIKTKRLERSFKQEIDFQIYEKLRGVIIDE